MVKSTVFDPIQTCPESKINLSESVNFWELDWTRPNQTAGENQSSFGKKHFCELGVAVSQYPIIY